jgi:hypothetical protein
VIARARGLVLDNADMSSSLTTSMSVVGEQFESRIDAAAANGVRWGSYSTLVDTVLHFPELDLDLEWLRSERSVGLTEDEVDTL